VKKILLSSIVASTLFSSTIQADLIGGIKDFGEKTMNKVGTLVNGEKHLSSLDYKSVYNKAFYKKSYFGFALTGAAIVGAGAFSYFTAGIGAPAAATGVSATASWIGGGGAGSYMAGLSTLGGWFGGNASLGAAILNGVSLGTIGGGLGTGATYTSLSVLGKVGVMATISASTLDGVFYISNPDTKQLEYRVKVAIPKDLGTGTVRTLVDKLYEIEEELVDTIENKKTVTQHHLGQLKNEYYRYAGDLLKYHLDKTNSQEDLMVLGIIAWNSNDIEQFNLAINKIDKSKLDNTAFLNYLYALQSLGNGNIKKAKKHLQDSLDENKFALEPAILYINILGNEDFVKNENKILNIVEGVERYFDKDEYSTTYSKVSIYNRLASYYFLLKRYVKAEEYYGKAYDELNIVQEFTENQLKHTILVNKANAIFAQGKTFKAKRFFNDFVNDIDEQKEKTRLTKQFLGYE
jgi:tetratricopeptide (TPR) repeat protein